MMKKTDDTRARWAFRYLLPALLVLAFVAAGCGSDDEDLDATADSVADEVSDAADDAADAAEDAAEDAADATDDTMTEEDAEEMVDDAATEADEAAEEAADEIDERSADIAQVLRDNDLESLASAVELVDASELLGDGEFTFFAPNDDAFLELDADQLADLLSDPAQLITVLQNHVVTERVDSTALAGMTSVTTRSGSSVSVSADGDAVTVGGANVVQADIDAADGVIHVIDSVILP